MSGFPVVILTVLGYIKYMTITQTVEIPANNRSITIEVPKDIPAGPVILTFTPVTEEKKKVPIFGCAKGQFRIADDFDAPLEDFKDYM